MSWVTRHFGLDGVDLGIQVAITAIGVAIVNSFLPGGPVADVLSLKVIGLSLLVVAWRRHRALKKAPRTELHGLSSGEMVAERFEDLEQRLADLEATQARVAELEERLDFAERLLAQQPDKQASLLRSGGPRG